MPRIKTTRTVRIVLRFLFVYVILMLALILYKFIETTR